MVVFAAGRSSRMGKQKLLLPGTAGEAMIRCTSAQAWRGAQAGGAGGVCIVCDPEQPEVGRALTGLPVTLLWNDQGGEQMSGSLHTASAYLRQIDAAAGLFLLGDEPELPATVVAAVLRRWFVDQPAIIQTLYDDGPGHPTLFAKWLFAELSAVTGDSGARPVLQSHRAQVVYVPVAQPSPADVDTPADYSDYLHRLHRL